MQYTYMKAQTREQEGAGSAERNRRVMSRMASFCLKYPKPKSVPDLYRRVQVVMSDGATVWLPSATRLPSNVLQLEMDTANHPVFLVSAH
jgi:hypothetical protein